MKFQNRTFQHVLLPLVVFFFVFGFESNLRNSFALPSGGKVQEGTATFDQPNSTTLNITTSNQAIINWNSFNIAQNEIVNFYQPLTSSSVLNRVIGGGISEIAGALNANGSVILVNPAGINFTSTANINVGSLIASSLNISDSNFMSGNYVFQNDSGLRAGMVINAGNITSVRPGGVVALLGGVVQNSGSIVAELGSVALAAGNKITLKFDPQGMIQADVTEGLGNEMRGPDGNMLSDAVSNLGRIVAGKIILTAEQISNVFARLVNTTGYIEANSVINQNGHILLVAKSGLVRNAGEIHAEGLLENTRGGEVDILGQDVKLEGALINTSGYAGGGTILIGGNYQGKGAESNALHTYVSNDSVLKADAVSSGNGGKVIVWADQITQYYGSISACGGDISGNGGLTEVSGKDYLDFDGKVNLTATHGATGILLLDPRNVTISSGATSGGAFGGGNPNKFTPTANNSVLNVVTLQNTLNLANVIVNTGSTGAQAGNITISATIAVPSANNLTLNAAGSITRTGASTIRMGGGSLTLIAGRGIGTSAIPILTTGLTSISATTGTGGIFILNSTSGNINITGMSTTSGAASTAGNISVTNNFAGGTITVTGAITGGANAAGSTGNILLTANGGNIIINSNISTGNATQADAAGNQTPTSGSITINTGTGSGNVSGSGALITGNASITGASAAGADVATSGNISITSAGGIGLSNGAAALRVGTAQRTGGGAGTDTAVVGNMTLVAAGEINNGTVSTQMKITDGPASGALTNTQGSLAVTTTGASGNAFLNSSSAIRLGAHSISQNYNLTAAGAITQNAALTITGISKFSAGANAITLTTATNSFTGAITLVNSGANNVSLTNNRATSLAASTVGQNLTIISNGAITQTGALTVPGMTSLSVTAAASDVLLGSQANNFTGTISFAGTLSNIRDVSLRNTNAGATVPSFAGLTNLRNLTLQFDNAAIAIGTTTLTSGGNLSLMAGGAITQTGVLTVAGTSSFSAGANAIILTTATNSFTGSITLSNSGANNVSLANNRATSLAASSVGQNLTITSNGAITQTGSLTVTGTTTLTAGAGNNITLADSSNDFSTVSIVSGNHVTLVDTNAIDLGASSISGTLSVTAGGAITDSGNLVVTGTATFAAGAANNITLDNANNFSTVVITSGKNVTLNDINAINLGASTISGILNVTTNGAITQSGTLTVTGTTTLAAGAGNNITLADPANDFSTVSIVSGKNVTLVDVNALNLGASTISGALNVTTNGSITDSGTLLITGTATFAAGCPNDIVLDTPTNDFSTVVITSGGNVTINDVNSLDLSTCNVCGNFGVSTVGGITNSGALTIGGTTNIVSTGLANIALTNPANSFTGAVTLSGGNISLVADTTNLILNTISATGFLSITTTGGASILDGNGVANNLTATAGASLRSAGIIGTNADPLEVTISGGTLTVAAGGIDPVTGISININGTVNPINALTVPVRPLGSVYFNGIDMFPNLGLDDSSDVLLRDDLLNKKRFSIAPKPAQYLRQEYQP